MKKAAIGGGGPELKLSRWLEPAGGVPFHKAAALTFPCHLPDTAQDLSPKWKWVQLSPRKGRSLRSGQWASWYRGDKIEGQRLVS